MTAVPVPAAAGGDAGFSCSCTKETWPTLLFGLGIGGSVLVCIVAVMDIIGGNTAYLILDCFLFLFGIIGAAAELRIFTSVRGLLFYFVKHVYFIVRPIGKGVFYLFVASLTWTPDFKILPMLTAILLAIVAVLNIGVDLAVGLPMYMDKEVQATLNEVVADAAAAHVRSQILTSTGAGAQRI
jgi:hypothetical protein